MKKEDSKVLKEKTKNTKLEFQQNHPSKVKERTFSDIQNENLPAAGLPCKKQEKIFFMEKKSDIYIYKYIKFGYRLKKGIASEKKI